MHESMPLHELTFRCFPILLIVCGCFLTGTCLAKTISAEFLQANSKEAAKWERYSARGEEFSVELPDEPTSIDVFRPRDLLEKPKPSGRMYGAYNDGVVYLVLSFDNLNGKEPLDVFIKEVDRYPINGRASKLEKDLM